MFTKYATIEEILDVRSSPSRLPYDGSPGLSKFAALKEYNTDDGYMYVRCRAISSKTNKNGDGWPSDELAAAYKTFNGRPIFVDHHNNDHTRTRGVIVDSSLHVDKNKTSAVDVYSGTTHAQYDPFTWIELLLEVDAKTYPKFASALRNGDISAVSMGANIGQSECSVCGHEAEDSSQYCDHIKKKGLTFEVESASGTMEKKTAFEFCHRVSFFEISGVFDPADDGADVLEKVGSAETKLPIGLLDDLWPLIHPGVSVDDVQQSLQKGDNDGALQAADKISQKEQLDGDQNPYYGMQAQDIVDDISSKMNSGDSDLSSSDPANPLGITSKLAALPPESFIEPYKSDDDRSPDRIKNQVPQADQDVLPNSPETLRDDVTCPRCHAATLKTDPDGIQKCPSCGFVQPPEPLDAPDLTPNKGEQGQNSGGENVQIEPVKPISPLGANKSAKASTGIYDMEWEIKLETTSKRMADKVLPAKESTVQFNIGNSNGIDFQTHQAFKDASLKARVRYPIEGDNIQELPGNPLKDFALTQRALAALHITDPAEIPLTLTSSDPRLSASLIREGGNQGTKKVLLPNSVPASNEPKNPKVVSDQFAPITSKIAELSQKLAELQITSNQWIKKDGNDWVIIQKGTGKVLSRHDSEEKAQASFSAMEANKHGNNMNKNSDSRHIRREEREEDGAVVRSEEIIESMGESNDHSAPDGYDYHYKQRNDPKSPDVDESELAPHYDTDEEAEDTGKSHKQLVEASERKLLAVFSLADELVDQGIIAREQKMATIAELEKETFEQIEARTKMLASVKEAGLAKTALSSAKGVVRIPRLAHNNMSNYVPDNGSLDSIPVEAIFNN